MLRAKVIKGTNLVSRDATGKSDPYVILQVDGITGGKTKKKLQTLNPTWNQTLEFPIENITPSSIFTLTCMDYDQMSSADFLGTCNKKFSELNLKKPGDKWTGKLKLLPLHVNEADTTTTETSSEPSTSTSTSKASKARNWFSSHFSSLHVTPQSSGKTRSSITGDIEVELFWLNDDEAAVSRAQFDDDAANKKSRFNVKVFNKRTDEAKAAKAGDSNIAHLGGKEEKAARKAAADNLKAIQGCGITVGRETWRVEKFKLIPWNKGFFFSGDSYLVLNTYIPDKKNPKKLLWNVHFWQGKATSIDERGSIAYYATIVDDYLHGVPVQYREVEGHESSLFLDMYEPAFITRDGGVDSGFTKVEDPYKKGIWKPVLYAIKGRGKHVRCRQIPTTNKSLNSGDCFILDDGYSFYSWVGSKANAFEKNRLGVISNGMMHERGSSAKTERIEEGSEPAAFWEALGGKGPIKSAQAGGDDRDVAKRTKPKMFKFSDESGRAVFLELTPGQKILKTNLDTNDAFIVDAGDRVWVWIGKGSSEVEKRESITIAETYLSKTGRPNYINIVRVAETHEPTLFWDAFK